MDEPDYDNWRLPRDSRRSKPDVIEDKLEELIGSGELPHDESLPGEQELARRFGVGRTSVRAALQRLQVKGIVDVEHGIGWRVKAELPTVPDALRREAEIVVEARIGLESHAARLAAKNATDKQLKQISVASDQHAAAVQAGDVEDMVRTDEDLHRLIIDAADNELISEMYKIIEERAHSYRRTMFAQYGKDAMRRSVDGHAILVRFIKYRDQSAAVAMENHIKTFAPQHV